MTDHIRTLDQWQTAHVADVDRAVRWALPILRDVVYEMADAYNRRTSAHTCKVAMAAELNEARDVLRANEGESVGNAALRLVCMVGEARAWMLSVASAERVGFDVASTGHLRQTRIPVCAGKVDAKQCAKRRAASSGRATRIQDIHRRLARHARRAKASPRRSRRRARGHRVGHPQHLAAHD